MVTPTRTPLTIIGPPSSPWSQYFPIYETWNIELFDAIDDSVWKPHPTRTLARCGCAQHGFSVEAAAVLTSTNRIVLDGDVGFQQLLWNRPTFKVDYLKKVMPRIQINRNYMTDLKMLCPILRWRHSFWRNYSDLGLLVLGWFSCWPLWVFWLWLVFLLWLVFSWWQVFSWWWLVFWLWRLLLVTARGWCSH